MDDEKELTRGVVLILGSAVVALWAWPVLLIYLLAFAVAASIGALGMFLSTKDYVDDLEDRNRTLLERNERLEEERLELERHGAHKFAEIQQVAEEHGFWAAIRRARKMLQ